MGENQDLKVLQGIDTVAFFRPLSKATTQEGQLMPWQTSLSFDPQRDSDTTATKDGAVATTSSVETDFEVEMLNNTSAVADMMYDSLLDEEKLEGWIVYRKRRNAEGKYFAWYLRVSVTEDSNDNDADDASTRDVTFTVDGKPKRGWLELPTTAQEQIDYIFRGLGKVTDEDPQGGGVDWDKEKDPGTNVESPASDSQAPDSQAAASQSAAKSEAKATTAKSAAKAPASQAATKSEESSAK